jgi:ATP-dependent Clp protease ATP-binding subunit ClpA
MDHHWFARMGSVWPVFWTGGQVLFSSARRQAMFQRFSDRARRVVVLAQEEARRLEHNYIGTEHILLGLIREGDGVAAQVLVRLGADLNRVRQQVILLLHEHPAEEPGPGARVRQEMVEQRLTAIEQRVGIGPDTRDLDEQIEVVRTEKEAAVDAQDFDQAASLRDREKQLLADKAARREQRTAEYPTLPELAERCQQLADEVDRIRALLRQHGIDPQDKPA